MMQGLSALASAAAEISSQNRRRQSPSLAGKAAVSQPSPREMAGKQPVMDIREGLPSLKLGLMPRTSSVPAGPSPFFQQALYTMASSSPSAHHALPPQMHSAFPSVLGSLESSYKQFGPSFTPNSVDSDMPLGTHPSMIFRGLEPAGAAATGQPGTLSLGPMMKHTIPGQTPLGSGKRATHRIKTPKMGLGTPGDRTGMPFGHEDYSGGTPLPLGLLAHPMNGSPRDFQTAHPSPRLPNTHQNMHISEVSFDNWAAPPTETLSGVKRGRTAEGEADSRASQRRNKRSRDEGGEENGDSNDNNGGIHTNDNAGEESASDIEAGVEAHVGGGGDSEGSERRQGSRMAAARALLSANITGKHAQQHNSHHGNLHIGPPGRSEALASSDEAPETPTGSATSDSDYRPPHHSRTRGSGRAYGEQQPALSALSVGAVLDAAGIPDPSRHSAVVTDPNAIAAYMPTGNSSAAARALPPTAIAVLKAWLLSPEHFDHPYPSDAEKEALGAQCGITVRQVSVWFTNARKRIWLPLRNKQMRMKNAKANAANGRGKQASKTRGSKGGGTSSAGIDELLYGDGAQDEDGCDAELGSCGEDDTPSLQVGLHGIGDESTGESDGAAQSAKRASLGYASDFGLSAASPKAALEEPPSLQDGGRSYRPTRASRGVPPRRLDDDADTGRQSRSPDAATRKAAGSPFSGRTAAQQANSVGSEVSHRTELSSTTAHEDERAASVLEASKLAGRPSLPALPAGSLSAHLRMPGTDGHVTFPFALSSIDPNYVATLIEHVDTDSAHARLQTLHEAANINRSELMSQLMHLTSLQDAIKTTQQRLLSR